MNTTDKLEDYYILGETDGIPNDLILPLLIYRAFIRYPANLA